MSAVYNLFEACKRNWRCYVCKGKHHTSLHTTMLTAATTNCEQSNIVLATAEIFVLSNVGRPMKYRALIDQGSMTSFITEKVAQQLQLTREFDSNIISGIGGGMQKSNGSTKIKFHSCHNKKLFSANVLILPRLTSWLPAADCKELTEYNDWELADPNFNAGGQIDILGVDLYKHIMLNETHNGRLLAQKTHLGYILSGVLEQKSTNMPWCMVAVSHEEDELTNVLQRFWETEEKIVEIPQWTTEEAACEKIYAESTYKDVDGRYVCRLPFKQSRELGRSKHIAVANMLQLEKKFKKNADLKEKYVASMRDYLEQGHAIPVPPNQGENSYRKASNGKLVYECYYIICLTSPS